jgi:hypothetical protein
MELTSVSSSRTDVLLSSQEEAYLKHLNNLLDCYFKKQDTTAYEKRLRQAVSLCHSPMRGIDESFEFYTPSRSWLYRTIESELRDVYFCQAQSHHFFYLCGAGVPLMLCHHLMYFTQPVKSYHSILRREQVMKIGIENCGLYRFIYHCYVKTMGMAADFVDCTKKDTKHSPSSQSTASVRNAPSMVFNKTSLGKAVKATCIDYVNHFNKQWIFTVADLVLLDDDFLKYIVYSTSEQFALRGINVLDQVYNSIQRMKSQHALDEQAPTRKRTPKPQPVEQRAAKCSRPYRNSTPQRSTINTQVKLANRANRSVCKSSSTSTTIEEQKETTTHNSRTSTRKYAVRKKTSTTTKNHRRRKHTVEEYSTSYILENVCIKPIDYQSTLLSKKVSLSHNKDSRQSQPSLKMQEEMALIVPRIPKEANDGGYFCLCCNKKVGKSYARRHVTTTPAGPEHKKNTKLWVAKNPELYRQILTKLYDMFNKEMLRTNINYVAEKPNFDSSKLKSDLQSEISTDKQTSNSKDMHECQKEEQALEEEKKQEQEQKKHKKKLLQEFFQVDLSFSSGSSDFSSSFSESDTDSSSSSSSDSENTCSEPEEQNISHKRSTKPYNFSETSIPKTGSFDSKRNDTVSTTTIYCKSKRK